MQYKDLATAVKDIEAFDFLEDILFLYIYFKIFNFNSILHIIPEKSKLSSLLGNKKK